VTLAGVWASLGSYDPMWLSHNKACNGWCVPDRAAMPMDWKLARWRVSERGQILSPRTLDPTYGGDRALHRVAERCWPNGFLEQRLHSRPLSITKQLDPHADQTELSVH
jgi:hypothetical protein